MCFLATTKHREARKSQKRTLASSDFDTLNSTPETRRKRETTTTRLLLITRRPRWTLITTIQTTTKRSSPREVRVYTQSRSCVLIFFTTRGRRARVCASFSPVAFDDERRRSLRAKTTDRHHGGKQTKFERSRTRTNSENTKRRLHAKSSFAFASLPSSSSSSFASSHLYTTTEREKEEEKQRLSVFVVGCRSTTRRGRRREKNLLVFSSLKSLSLVAFVV